MMIKLDACDFKRALSAVSKHVSKDKARVLITRVLVRAFDSGRVEVVALNGYSMAVRYMGLCESHNWPDGEARHDFLIDKVDVPKGATFVTLDDSGDQIQIGFDNGYTCKQEKMRGDFVDIYRIMGRGLENETTQIVVNPKILIEALNSVKEDNWAVLTFSNPLSPIVIDGRNARSLALPVRPVNNDVIEFMHHIYSRHYEHD